MPVIRRKLASSPAPRRAVVSTPINARRPRVATQLAPQQSPESEDVRGVNVRRAAKYLGTSVWQVRKYFREGVLKPFPIGNKKMVDRADLDGLIERLKAVS